MKSRVRITEVLPLRTGVSQRTGQPWASQEYVGETVEQYPHRLHFRVFGEDRINGFALKKGEEATVSFDIDAHEYNGRWYDQINVWDVERCETPKGAPQPQEAAGRPQATPPAQRHGGEPVAQDTEDLPF